jgi:hypothetical protein
LIKNTYKKKKYLIGNEPFIPAFVFINFSIYMEEDWGFLREIKQFPQREKYWKPLE